MKGLSYPVYSVGAINSLLFGVYVKSLESLGSSSYGSILVAGALSGAAQLSLAVPVDLVKVRLQASGGEEVRRWSVLSFYSFQAGRVPSSVSRASTLRRD